MPPSLRAGLLAELRRSRAQRDRLLRELADALDPDERMGRWQRAQLVAKATARFMRPENRARRGLRVPDGNIEDLLLRAWQCGCGLPTSSRRIWDALDDFASWDSVV